MQDLRITAIQTHLIWENIDLNLQHFDKKLSPLKNKTDLVVLPEMFSTGFTLNSANCAETTKGKTMKWLAQKAAEINAVITGSFIIEETQKYYNRLVWMYPDGHYLYYDKRHLFTLANEQHNYTSGTKKLIVEWKGWKICPLICYDLRFPAWSRNQENYDLLIYVANFPLKRRYAWKQLLIARAIENQCYTLGVNRIGQDGNDIVYAGDSMLLDFEGQIQYQISFKEASLTNTISYQQQVDFRKRFNFLNDKDDFQIFEK